MGELVIKNINSEINISQSIIDYAVVKSNFLSGTWSNVNVYTINAELMDKLFPSIRRGGFDEKCLENKIKKFKHHREYEPEQRNNDGFWQDISDCWNYERNYKYPVIACYIDDFNGHRVNDKDIFIPEGPTIFICSERIFNWSNKLDNINYSEGFKILFTYILIHELVHAFNKTEDHIYNDRWGVIIEESLASYIAFSLLDIDEQPLIKRFVNSQSFEYRLYIFWLRFNSYANCELDDIAFAWKEKSPVLQGKLFNDVNKYLVINFRSTLKKFDFKNGNKNGFDFWRLVAEVILHKVTGSC